MRALREEMARLKGTVAQIRGQCANDIRRRDGELSRLKRHLEGRRGREGNGGQVGVVVVTGGPTRTQFHGSRENDFGADLASPEYSLKQETTEFLTQLTQNLSDENDALIALVRNTLATLRTLQGLPVDSANGHDDDPRIGGAGSTNMMMMVLPTYEELATSTDEVLEHLRGLLTNPSFVPLEEVEIREEEIVRLREGLERMVARWKEAVAMMDGWRKRMVDSGDTINLEDLTKGINLGSEVPSVPENRGKVSTAQMKDQEELSEWAKPEQRLESPPKSPGLPPLDDGDIDAVVASIPGDSNILKDRSGNPRPIQSPRKVSFPAMPEEKAYREEDEIDASLLDFSAHKAAFSPIKSRCRVTELVSIVSCFLIECCRANSCKIY